MTTPNCVVPMSVIPLVCVLPPTLELSEEAREGQTRKVVLVFVTKMDERVVHLRWETELESARVPGMSQACQACHGLSGS